MPSKQASRRWHQANKGTLKYKTMLKNNRLKSRYGITSEDYAEMLKSQNSLCLICEEEKPLHVDHCHSTGKVRGLLCHSCNNGLGCFKDSSERCLKAADYLRSG